MASDKPWRFPRGAGALSPELIDEAQRSRLFEATCAVFAEQGGYGRTTIEKIAARAGVSTRTFYQLFDGKDECVLAAHRAYADQLGAALAEAFAGPGAWSARVRAAIGCLLAYGEHAPLQLRFLLLDAQTAGPQMLAEQRRAGESLAAALRQGRAEAAAAELPSGTEEMLLAALAWAVVCRLLDGEPLAPLEPELAEFALAPYLGVARARRVARGSA